MMAARVRLILKLIWIFFGGLWLALSYLALGVLACLLPREAPAAGRSATFRSTPIP